MAFIREKKTTVNGKTYGGYYQLVEGYREDGKVKHRVVEYLGKHPSMEAAREELEKRRVPMPKKVTEPWASERMFELWHRHKDGENVFPEVGAILERLTPRQHWQLYHAHYPLMWEYQKRRRDYRYKN